MIIAGRKITALKGLSPGQSSAPILRVMSWAFSSDNLPAANRTRRTIAVFLIPLCLAIGCAESSDQRAQRLDRRLSRQVFAPFQPIRLPEPRGLAR